MDVRWTRYRFPLSFEICVVIEDLDGKRKTFPLYYFKKEDLAEFFHLARRMNPSVSLTENVMGRVRIWEGQS